MLEKDSNGNPISTFPPCCAFQMIFTALAPRLIQSISCNVHNKFRALKQLCGIVVVVIVVVAMVGTTFVRVEVVIIVGVP